MKATSWMQARANIILLDTERFDVDATTGHGAKAQPAVAVVYSVSAERDDRGTTYRMSGRLRRKDGSVGKRLWPGVFTDHRREELPPELADVLDAELARAARDFAQATEVSS